LVLPPEKKERVDEPEVEMYLNTTDSEMGAEQGAEAQQAPQMRDTMQR
jgi:hypothetical protein